MSSTSKDDLRPEYDLDQLKGGVRGKYRMRDGHANNAVVSEPDLARAFPDAKAVNDALRELLERRKARSS